MSKVRLNLWSHVSGTHEEFVLVQRNYDEPDTFLLILAHWSTTGTILSLSQIARVMRWQRTKQAFNTRASHIDAIQAGCALGFMGCILTLIMQVVGLLFFGSWAEIFPVQFYGFIFIALMVATIVLFLAQEIIGGTLYGISKFRWKAFSKHEDLHQFA